jgi:hypothetical protein
LSACSTGQPLCMKRARRGGYARLPRSSLTEQSGSPDLKGWDVRVSVRANMPNSLSACCSLTSTPRPLLSRCSLSLVSQGDRFRTSSGKSRGAPASNSLRNLTASPLFTALDTVAPRGSVEPSLVPQRDMAGVGWRRGDDACQRKIALDGVSGVYAGSEVPTLRAVLPPAQLLAREAGT